MPKIQFDISKLFQDTESIPFIPLNHTTGKKRVFLTSDNTSSNLTQVAFAYIDAGKQIEMHLHPTMEEYFFITKGEGIFTINEESQKIQPNKFIFVPANTQHSIFAESNLEFLYWGIAIP